ncbi:hypothetical protein PYJP_05800 [Pyrofollis japonicus]|uniref:DEAD/DEAH box helicase n=1 Tax=Pyrofollis japonicus TaxID=3060460 RepID=UPI00295BB48B|nr:DEAD/DEAH box helicase family protein [Pyrofollis japonicus]BEP17228.1 hypothetical protein PYJP_05800 [Pyrofollis japonicus]
MARAPRVRQKPRKYQLEAYEWAYRVRRGVVVLPTGTGKTLVAVMWAKRLIEEGKARRVLFLEPTRFLVEQVARYVRWVSDLPAEPVHGAVPRHERERRWRSSVVVATPEIVISDWELVEKNRVDAVVVDECHHTTGKDAYKEVMQRLSSTEYRLGLSAFIPRHRRREIEETIGEIREWSWSSPEVAPYIPPWIGEVYEAFLNEAEKKLYDALEELGNTVAGRLRGLVRNALRWFVRDGALALRESASKETLLARMLDKVRDLIFDPGVRPSHKAEPFRRVLRDHEGYFSKTIVFIDRVVVAEYACSVAQELGYGCVLIRGRMRGTELREALERAAAPETRVVVSTSAGEEGVDLPEADLLVMWSITASPLRFIQRHGRVLRAREESPRKPRIVVYIVTLDTIDVDSFVDAIETAKKIGIDIPVDEETVESLWRRTTRSRIVSVLEGNPMPLELLAEATGMPRDRLERDLQRLMQHGEVLYIYTGIGKIYAYSGDIEILEERFKEYLEPEEGVKAKAKYLALGSKTWSRAVSGDYARLYQRLSRIVEEKPLQRLIISLEVRLPSGLVKLVNLQYNFLIDNEDKLRLVLRNALAAPKIVKELGTIPA